MSYFLEPREDRKKEYKKLLKVVLIERLLDEEEDAQDLREEMAGASL